MISHSIREMIDLASALLQASGICQPRKEAEEMIADFLSVKRVDLYLQFDRKIEGPLEPLWKAIERRSTGEPRAYIAERVVFAGLNLKVNSDVLIPRQETELMIEKISKTLSNMDLKNKVLWDLCTGSGCIGLSLKRRFPQLEVILSDLSEKALQVASANNQEGVELRQGDLFVPFIGMQCDFFVCNPPYVTSSDYLTLQREVREWEPKLALIAGETGLEFYARIAKELKVHLKSGGLAWLEIGSGQGKDIKCLFESEGWKNCDFEPDWAGHDRFFHIS